MESVKSYRGLWLAFVLGVVATVGADTYTDPKNVFKIFVPRGWKREDTTFSEPKSGVSVDVKSIGIPASKLGAWAEATQSSLKPNGFKLSRSSKVSLAGQTAILIEGTLPSEGKMIRVELTLSVKNNHGVAITVAGLEESFPKDATIARECTKTFKWL